MAKLKKIAAACTAAIMCVAMTGCTDTSYVMSVDDYKVNAGVYIYNMLSEMSYQMTMMYYTNGVTENYFEQQIDGQDFAEYMSDYALKSTKEYLAVVKEFDKLGLELTDDEKSEISDSLNSTWESYGDFYESEGIAKASVKLAMQEAQMRTDIFNYYYDEGGVEEVTNSDIEKYLNENYIRYKQISIAKSTEEDENTSAAADSESEALRDEYLAKAEGLSFDEFDSVIDEYNDYVAQQEAADSSSIAETNSTVSDDSTASATVSDDDSTVDETESTADSASDDTSSVAESDSSVSTDSAISSESVADSADSTSDDSSEVDPATAESNEHPNDVMTNYGTMDDDTKDTDSGKLATEVNGLVIGVATAYEDDSNYYILIKGDVTERSSAYAEANRDTMLQEMKSDEFDEKVTSWVDELSISINNKAIKRYTPKVVYDKQEEYYASNS